MNPRTEQRSQRSGASPVATAVGLTLCIVLGLLLACNITILLKGTLDPDTPPSVLGVTPLVVLSGSMSGDREGHIEVGDLIFVEEADPAALEPGDVIAYLDGGSTVTHRIISVETAADGGLQFTTQGDANAAPDTAPVTEAQLVGVYRGRIPGLGDFVLFLQEPVGMLLFIGVPVLAFIGYDLLRRRRYARRQQRQARDMEAELARLRAQVRAEEALPPELDDWCS